MSNIQIYVDGSATRQKQSDCKITRKKFLISWGFVALFNDQSTEVMGRHEFFSSAPRHELFAFIEAYLFAKARGFSHEQMTFHTDDEMVAYASFFLHKDNKRHVNRQTIHTIFMQICDQHYTRELYVELIQCLQTSRFTKVKGHCSTVYNLRADYLAKAARGHSSIIPFEEWLSNGFLKYAAGGPHMWLAPFARQ